MASADLGQRPERGPRQSTWLRGSEAEPHEAENLSAFGCQTETANSPQSPYFANWGVTFQT